MGEKRNVGAMVLAILFIVFVVSSIVDSFYLYPVAAQKANDYCKSAGFDQQKSFDRIGIFSVTPVAIKCEYAERYTDLGVRVND